MVSWEYLWTTLRCRREAGVSPILSVGWWYLSSVSPKRHCFRVSAADKGCRVYPFDPRPDAVVLYSGCAPGKRRAWFLPGDRHTASLVGLRGGWRHARTKMFTRTYGHNAAVPGSGDLLIETLPTLQTKSFLLANTFLDTSVTISPHELLNTSRGVISEPDLLSTPESEILEGFFYQGVIQVRRITIKKDAIIIPTKHLILTFNSSKLPPTIKAGYLKCKIRPYIPNPLRCFKCQRFGHSQTSCRGQLTGSRCASVGHASTDCNLEQKCVNCSQPHSSGSKLCPKWKTGKEIHTIKTNRNLSYLEARKLIAPQLSQTYAEVTKPSVATSTTQTDENITKIKCPPLQLLRPLSSVPKPNASPSISTSSSNTQANLLPSASLSLSLQ
ncbi:uncharacterized protein TNCV_1598131 [Trichonephila clavipes]|nr:uncharacterized protein TNCV_1598131 [Trichonephila clavipes]